MQLKAGYWYWTRKRKLAYVAHVWSPELRKRFSIPDSCVATGFVEGEKDLTTWAANGRFWERSEEDCDLIEEIGPNPPVEMVAGHFYEVEVKPETLETVHVLGKCPFSNCWVCTFPHSVRPVFVHPTWILIRDLGPELPEAAQ